MVLFLTLLYICFVVIQHTPVLTKVGNAESSPSTSVRLSSRRSLRMHGETVEPWIPASACLPAGRNDRICKCISETEHYLQEFFEKILLKNFLSSFYFYLWIDYPGHFRCKFIVAIRRFNKLPHETLY